MVPRCQRNLGGGRQASSPHTPPLGCRATQVLGFQHELSRFGRLHLETCRRIADHFEIFWRLRTRWPSSSKCLVSVQFRKRCIKVTFKDLPYRYWPAYMVCLKLGYTKYPPNSMANHWLFLKHNNTTFSCGISHDQVHATRWVGLEPTFL